MLFEYLDGEATGKAPEDIATFAGGLAALHVAGSGYRGVRSAYALDLDYLVRRPVERLLRAPTVTAPMRPQFEAIAQRLCDRIDSFGALQRVLCHGDAHGENNFVAPLPDGSREARFFDFDEAGPGYLAYELAVYPWSLHPRVPDGRMTDERMLQWRGFIDAYRRSRPVADRDLAAIPSFMAARQFWLLGEYAGRIPVWGSQAMPPDYLRRQAVMLAQWETLALPG